MKLKEFVEELRKLFYKEVSSKTGWGKNEIISAFDKCVGDALMEVVERRLSDDN